MLLNKVIAERMVLLRIKDFKQGGGWITAKVTRHFVNFVKKEDRVFLSLLFLCLE